MSDIVSNFIRTLLFEITKPPQIFSGQPTFIITTEGENKTTILQKYLLF
jgi:hypothetical protein